MLKYYLRTSVELLEDIRILGEEKRKLEENHKLALDDIASDASVIKAELDLLKSLGLLEE